MKKILFAICSLVLHFNCGSISKIDNYQAEGNLKSFNRVNCVSIQELKNSYTPADIFPAMRKCIDLDNFDMAANLSAVAGAYGQFDIYRIEDRSAHQAIPALRANYMGDLNTEKIEKYQNSIRMLGKQGSTEFGKLCSQVKMLGKPNYYPTYMLQHGLSAFKV